jgi:RNA polymerase sigma-70 factor (ECF subfamily)
MTTDAELLRRARTDAHAFRELYDRYAARMLAFHLGRTGDADAAHDLTAETFAEAWRSRKRFRDEAGGSAGPWLFGIARHVLAASVRRGRLERAACTKLGLLERLDREPASAEPAAAWLDGLDDALEAALEELPDDQQRAIELRVVDELAYAEVAGSLHTTPGAARVRVHRGLAALRDRLTKEER